MVLETLLNTLEVVGIMPLDIVIFFAKIIFILALWVITKKFVINFDSFLRKNKTIMKTLKRIGIDERRFDIIDAIIDLGTYVVFILFTIYLFGLTSLLYTFLTAAGVMGVVIGFGVKETVSNMLAGIMIKLNQPFKKGHFIKVDDKYAGTVKKISMNSTTIVSYDGIPTILPNTLLVTKPLINYSVESKRLIDIEISLSPYSKTEKAMDILEKIAKKEKDRIKSEAIQVFVNEIKEYIIVVKLRFWAPRSAFWTIKRRTMKKIAQEFKKNKITLAIPLRRTIGPGEI